MTRLRNPQIVEELTSLRTDIDTLKAAQKIGGDSLLGYLTNSTNLYDYVFHIDTSANKNFLLTFVPTNNAFPAIVNLYFFYSIFSPDVMATAVPPWGAAVVNVSMQKYPPTTTASQWYMTFQDSDGTGASFDIHLKFIFSATDTGTWSIVPV